MELFLLLVVLQLGSTKLLAREGMKPSKCWVIQDGGLSRSPQLTIMTNSCHFCNLSLVKKHHACSMQLLDDTQEQGQANRTDHPDNSQGYTNVDEPKCVTIAGEQPSEIG
ncbi:hypothetical protein PanWU01x14_186680 [Parasponia andersonii]|uniref:Uncharacterized protein n=1 Tax=Parasponia andersonii TaxID=3476 RepID=A0A2P5C3V7_PARAD|nr:hypothetical protein PanWU01x14_186680 [Parasponia andersonii]